MYYLAVPPTLQCKAGVGLYAHMGLRCATPHIRFNPSQGIGFFYQVHSMLNFGNAVA
jgi:hypothetical protein